MALQYVKCVLLEGDYGACLDTIIKIKRGYFPDGCSPDQWTTFTAERKGEDYTIKDVANALSASSFDDSQRCVLLRGLPNRKEIREGLQEVVPQIQSPHTLIIWDSHGAMSNVSWNPLRAECKRFGRVPAMPVALEGLRSYDQPGAVIDIGKANGIKLLPVTAQALLELIGPNRSLISAELKGLSELGEMEPSVEIIRELVLPTAVDYPVWLFYAAFNSGSFKAIMDSAGLLLRNKYAYDIILMFAAKQCRWQVLAAWAWSQKKDPGSVLRAAGGAVNEEPVKKRLFAYKPDKRLFRKLDDADMPKRETLTSEPMIRDISNFVTQILPKIKPDNETAAQFSYRRSIERYLAAHQAYVDLRESGSESMFVNAIRNLSTTR